MCSAGTLLTTGFATEHKSRALNSCCVWCYRERLQEAAGGAGGGQTAQHRGEREQKCTIRRHFHS